jgi:glycosyltransferase involved in cell wall biosynthesis
VKGLTIFHLDGERTLRGGERQLLLLAAELERRGHRNVVVCRSGAPLEAEALEAGLETLSLPFLTEFDPVSAWRLRRKALERERPLLHSHTSHTAGLAFLAAQGSRLGRVSHRRVSFPPGRGLGFELKYKSAHATVAVSDFVRTQLIEAGLEPSKAHTVPDALPPGLTPAFAQASRARRGALAAELSLDPDALWLGNFAALTREKGQATLLRAYARLRDRFPRSALIIAGEGPLAGPLSALAEELGVAPHVRFLGWRADASSLIACLDLYTQPSLAEGFGSVVLVAMACGVPVVAARTGGLAELVRAGETGWSAQPGDDEGLAAALQEALRDSERRSAVARSARDRAADYSVERMADRMEAVYTAAEPR